MQRRVIVGLTIQADDFSHDGSRLKALLIILLIERLEVIRGNILGVAAE